MEISKEKFLEMAKWGNKFELSILKKDFPEAFKIKLEVGKFYKDTGGQLINFQGGDNAYGFAAGGFYNNDGWGISTLNRLWVEASKDEWESKLIIEAKRRGLYDAKHFKHANTLTSNHNANTFNPVVDTDVIWTKYGCIFNDGIWAEIIETISKEEAEKQLGLKII